MPTERALGTREPAQARNKNHLRDTGWPRSGADERELRPQLQKQSTERTTESTTEGGSGGLTPQIYRLAEASPCRRRDSERPSQRALATRPAKRKPPTYEYKKGGGWSAGGIPVARDCEECTTNWSGRSLRDWTPHDHQKKIEATF